MSLYDYENQLRNSGYNYICGIDEAGRGPLAGPVCAAAVILPKGLEIDGLNDSKKLSEAKRESLYNIIISNALYYGIAFADEKEIDRINILNATYLAMNRAADKLSIEPDICLIDGNKSDGFLRANECIIKGDSKCACIAAASILAKVTRDRYMLEMDKLYPEYQFAKHKGYGTKVHYDNIKKYGICDIHRLTFLKKMH